MEIAEAQKEKDEAREAKAEADAIIQARDTILDRAKEKAGEMISDAEDKVHTLKVEEIVLKTRVDPLKKEIAEATLTLEITKKKENQIRIGAYDDGYKVGVKAGKQEYAELIRQEETVVSDAKKKEMELSQQQKEKQLLLLQMPKRKRMKHWNRSDSGKKL